ncbi:Endo-1-3(4)-beta-glucanase [Penicillium sp. IBT 35674x]|nr:Endo-1-3(4)-beta-glucanase [Penicillium sp. IBT 35674x]
MLECTLFIILMLLARAAGADYRLAQNFSPFLEQFDFDTGSDPTNGYVDYVDKRTAIELGLVKLVNGTFHIGVEHKDAALPPGRKSVRLTSKKAYSTGTLVVVDLSHMPGVACGSWPAFWTVGENWPLDGEIDIIEGANRALYNQMTLHTGKNCTIDSTGFSGNLLTSNCDVDAAGQSGNAGCGIEAGSATSFGSHFNSIGGGIYAMEWTSNGIGVWFFPRYQIPTGFMSRPSHDPDGWGEPVARFQGDCQIAQHFHKQKITKSSSDACMRGSAVVSIGPRNESNLSVLATAHRQAHDVMFTLDVPITDPRNGNLYPNYVDVRFLSRLGAWKLYYWALEMYLDRERDTHRKHAVFTRFYETGAGNNSHISTLGRMIRTQPSKTTGLHYV